MIITLAADHRGFKLKEEIKIWLIGQGLEVKDFGANQLVETDDYPDYGTPAAEFVAADLANRKGILICGSGQGMALAANKVENIRAIVIDKPGEFKLDEDPNILAIGADFLGIDDVKVIFNEWVKNQNKVLDSRHLRRIEKIEKS